MANRKTTRWRWVVLDHFDEAMLTFALRDAFSRVIVVTDLDLLRSPKLDERPHLAQPRRGENWAPNLDVLFPESGWEPAFQRDGHFHFLANPPRHRIFYRRGDWEWGAVYGEEPKWAFSLPTPTRGDFIIEYDRKEEGDRAFVRDVWRTMKRLATNRLKSELPHLGVVYDTEIRGDTWVGHHVLEWCQKADDRMIDGSLRPIDGWKAPDTPWHRDLRARVIAQFGHEFDEPKEPEGRYHDGPFAVDFSRGFSVGKPR